MDKVTKLSILATNLAEEVDDLKAQRDELLEALEYARRCIDPQEHDAAFIDAAIAKARNREE